MYITSYQERQEKIEKMRHRFPAGTRVMITRYNDKDISSKDGLATVQLIDDFGVVKVVRDDGTIIRIIPGMDSMRFLTDAEMSAEAEKRISERERQK